MRLTNILATLALVQFVASAATAQVGTNNGVLNPNLASEEELGTLPHLSSATVERILADRPFASMTALHEVLSPSLGEDQLTELYERLFIPINLNSASSEEIGLIPGVGSRMTHEFEEYRPYPALAQFRREIGKYVSDEEVARLEQYVFVPLNLNTASREDFLTIPGVGDRMVHEFMEYRPYVNMAQFRREIGKYVSDEEVARFERYLTLN
jgi:DNA uptake protein ComE-like DNA-binding protein